MNVIDSWDRDTVAATPLRGREGPDSVDLSRQSQTIDESNPMDSAIARATRPVLPRTKSSRIKVERTVGKVAVGGDDGTPE